MRPLRVSRSRAPMELSDWVEGLGAVRAGAGAGAGAGAATADTVRAARGGVGASPAELLGRAAGAGLTPLPRVAGAWERRPPVDGYGRSLAAA